MPLPPLDLNNSFNNSLNGLLTNFLNFSKEKTYVTYQQPTVVDQFLPILLIGGIIYILKK